MGRDKKTAKGRLDKYYHMAKEQGYRSRAAFKLIQLNKKYNFLESARVVIDLCAAPGGWMQVARKYSPTSSIIVGIDLSPIKPIRNCIALQEDITTEKCRQNIKKELKTWKADVVLHDGAPNVGTAWVQDAFTQVELALRSLQLATEFLRDGGTFVTKVFRSKDYFAFMWVLNQLFKKVHATKPPSSRNVSAEIFVVCQGYKAPATIDPRLLDPKHVFLDVDRPKDAGENLFREKKKKAAANGYEDGIEVLYKRRNVAQFVETPDALAFLADTSEIALDGDWENHIATTNEIRELVKDIKVLGKKELRQLLKWREAMRKTWQENDKAQGNSQQAAEDGADSQSEDEIEMTAEERDMLEIDDEVKAAMEEARRTEKAKRRKEYKHKVKTQERLALKMDLPGDRFDIEQDESLFSLKQVRGAKELAAVSEVTADDLLAGSEAEWSTDSEKEDLDDMGDSDLNDDELAYKRQRERELDMMFAEHKARHEPGGRAASVLARTKAGTDKTPKLGKANGETDNPLLVSLRQDSAASARAKMWFAQDEFKDILDDREPAMDESEDEQKASEPTKRPIANSDEGQSVNGNKRRKQEDDNDFEVVPEQEVQSTDSEDELTDSDDEMVEADSQASGAEPKVLDAHGLALGTMMLKKKSKQAMIDDAYNRHAFTDDILPEWFVDHEKKYRTGPIKEVPKDMLEYYRQRMKELNARPIKKIAEAKARKKMKEMRKVETMKKKMESVMNNGDIGEGAKAKEIEKLMKRKNKKAERREVKYVVAKKGRNRGRPAGVKGPYKMVDGRMKKDARAMKRADQRKGTKKSSTKKR